MDPSIAQGAMHVYISAWAINIKVNLTGAAESGQFHAGGPCNSDALSGLTSELEAAAAAGVLPRSSNHSSYASAQVTVSAGCQADPGVGMGQSSLSPQPYSSDFPPSAGTQSSRPRSFPASTFPVPGRRSAISVRGLGFALTLIQQPPLSHADCKTGKSLGLPPLLTAAA